MKPRHAAALALVGWYLMIPPTNQDVTNVDTDAPISKWDIDSSHDTAIACENERSRSAMKLLPPGKDKKKFIHETLHPKDSEELQVAKHFAAKCIATDDPRLKEK